MGRLQVRLLTRAVRTIHGKGNHASIRTATVREPTSQILDINIQLLPAPTSIYNSAAKSSFSPFNISSMQHTGTNPDVSVFL